MKRILQLTFGITLSTSLVFAQSFSDNFDSYTVGEGLAAQSSDWTTWSNAPGTNEDVLVTDADAYSAPNSIYFSSNSPDGGPSDVIKQFGAAHTTGVFNLEMWMKVENNKGAYFNVQGASPLGSMFVFESFWFPNGDFQLVNQGDGVLLEGEYPNGEWFKLNLDIDLTLNEWKISINEDLIGSFASSDNQIWGIDFYPYNPGTPPNAGYFIDDFSYSHQAFTPEDLDLAITNVEVDAKLAGMEDYPRVTVRNIGNTNITSFEIETEYDGSSFTQEITGVNIPFLESYTFTLENNITLSNTIIPLTTTISNVNGEGEDDNTSNDTKTIDVNTIVPTPGKMVAVEQGTGTWCTWCPRGAVSMAKYAKIYEGAIVPIAVHYNDPMALPVYDNGLAFPGYPYGKVDRITSEDPSLLEPAIIERLTHEPVALLTNGATWNSETRELNVSITSEALDYVASTYRIALVITEDSVRGTTNNYAQQNSYSGGNYGPMGGYESLPNPVPASMMHYNYVARLISPSFPGYAGSFSGGLNAGESRTLNFTYYIPESWDENQIKIVAILRASNGSVDNASMTTISEAVENGLIDGEDITVSVETFDAVDALVKMYPNPASDFTTVTLNLKDNQEVLLELVDVTGKVINSKNYGSLNGGQELIIPTDHLDSGVYLVKLQIGNQFVSKKLIIE